MTAQPRLTTRTNGIQEWRLANGQLHRIDGPAYVHPNGTDEWWQHGKLHRVDGPAVTYTDGSEFWYQHGQRHRVGGPACTYSDGTRQWWINGVRLEGFEAEVARRAWEQNGCPR